MAIILIITRLKLKTITKTNFLISNSYHTTTRFILLLMTAKIDLKKNEDKRENMNEMNMEYVSLAGNSALETGVSY